MFFFQNLTAELLLFESPDDSYFPKSGGSTFLKTVGSHFSEICGNKVTAYTATTGTYLSAMSGILLAIYSLIDGMPESAVVLLRASPQ